MAARFTSLPLSPLSVSFSPVGMMRPMYRMPDYRRQDMGGMEGGPGGLMGGRPGGPGGPKQAYNQRHQGQQQGGGIRGRQQGRMVQAGPGGMMGGGMPQHMQAPMGGPAEGGYQHAQEGVQGGAPQGGAIDPTRLASASLEEQKTILGEQLYPLIVRREPELAGKITGMILELDNTVGPGLRIIPDSFEFLHGRLFAQLVGKRDASDRWGAIVRNELGTIPTSRPGVPVPPLWPPFSLTHTASSHILGNPSLARIPGVLGRKSAGGDQGAPRIQHARQGRLGVTGVDRGMWKGPCGGGKSALGRCGRLCVCDLTRCYGRLRGQGRLVRDGGWKTRGRYDCVTGHTRLNAGGPWKASGR